MTPRPRRTLALLAVLALLLAIGSACAGDDDEPQPSLAGTTWELQTLPTGNEINETPGDPSKYVLAFTGEESGGDLQITADCNNSAAQWEHEGLEGLRITMGPTTLVECGPDSLSSMFLAALPTVTGYFIENEGMTLATPDGVMRFQKQD